MDGLLLRPSRNDGCGTRADFMDSRAGAYLAECVPARPLPGGPHDEALFALLFVISDLYSVAWLTPTAAAISFTVICPAS
jgi:hypothetical protein